MDCVIPGHSVRPFCASIACLSKIGKDLYIEFDPIDGLALRSLNDAKSAYACIRFQPSYFERCTAPLLTPRKRTSLLQDDEEEEPRFSCRVTVRALAPVLRPRKHVSSLRIRSEVGSDNVYYLSFEFHTDTLLRVVHRIKAADANGVSAVASKDEASEIVASPKVLLRLLDPLKRTTEASLVIRGDGQMVQAASFHHVDVGSGGSAAGDNNNNNAVLQQTHASLLKTETGIGCDEFEEFFFRQDRNVSQVGSNMPEDVNDQVILVFPIKEAKAMMQFCSSLQAGLHTQSDQLELARSVAVFFHWGGKPMVIETSTTDTDTSFSAQLVLATLDHKLLHSQHEQQQRVTAAGAKENNNSHSAAIRDTTTTSTGNNGDEQ